MPKMMPPTDFLATPPCGAPPTRRHAGRELAAVLEVLDTYALKMLANHAAKHDSPAGAVAYVAAMDALWKRLPLAEFMAFQDEHDGGMTAKFWDLPEHRNGNDRAMVAKFWALPDGKAAGGSRDPAPARPRDRGRRFSLLTHG